MKQSGCYILCYYFPEFVRTATLIQALQRIEYLTLYTAINTTRSWLRYWQTLSQLILIRLHHNPDFYILGFRGYELFWLVRLITWGRPLIFDHMMSPYDSLVYEKKLLRPGSLLAKFVYRYEKNLLKHADLILTDTSMHQRYFANLFRLNELKIHPIHVAADERLFVPCPNIVSANNIPLAEAPLRVFFYGSFLPLHGVDVILQAANILTSLPIHFTLVGGHKQNLDWFQALQTQLNLHNITHIPWVDYQDLPALACQADLCLGGPFGNTGQARRVITGKTFQFLALGQPTVVGLVESNDYFIHQHNCLLVKQGDPTNLAEVIAWAASHRTQLPEIGRHGRALYEDSFSIVHIHEQLKTTLQDALLST